MANRLSVTNAELREMAKRFQHPRRKEKAIRVTREVRKAWQAWGRTGYLGGCRFCSAYRNRKWACSACPASAPESSLCSRVIEYHHGASGRYYRRPQKSRQVVKLCDRMILALQGKL